MTDKQLYTLCGTIAFVGGAATNSLPLYVWAISCFVASILTHKN